VSGVTSPILRKQLARFGVNLGSRQDETVRSLCAMQTTGNRVTRTSVEIVGLPDAWPVISAPGSSGEGTGEPEPNCRFQASTPARGVIVR